MRRNVAILTTALAVLFLFGTIFAYFGQAPYQKGFLDFGGYVPSDGTSNNNVDSNVDSGTSSSDSVYPTISIVKHDDTWYTDRYVKEGYRFVFDNDNRAGSATESWLKKVKTQADDKIKNTKRDENVVFNDYVRSAMKQRGVAFLEEYEKGTSYSNGRDLIIFVDNSDGETKVLEVSKDDTEFDFGDLKDPDEVLSTPEAMVPEKEAKNWFEQALEKFNTTSVKAENTSAVEKIVYVKDNTTPAEKQYVLIDAASGQTVGQQVTEPAPAAQTSKVTPYKSARSGSAGTSSSSGTSGSTSSSKKSVTPYKSART